MTIKHLCFSVGAFTIFHAIVAFGDIAPVTPAAHGLLCIDEGGTVEMRSERVSIVLFPSHAEVSAVFEMRNLSDDDATVTVGFPSTAARALEKGRPAWSGGLQEMAVEVDGEVVALRKPVDDNERYANPFGTWPQTFPGKATTRVHVSYWTSTHTGKNKADGSERVKHFSYVLLTGGAWRGDIAHAVVTVDLSRLADPCLHAYWPFGFTYDETKATLRWDLTQFEPTPHFLDEIGIRYTDGPAPKGYGHGRDPAKLSGPIWKPAIRAIDSIAQDAQTEIPDRIALLCKFENCTFRTMNRTHWRIQQHVYRTIRLLGQQLVDTESIAGFTWREAGILGRAQFRGCFDAFLQQLANGTAEQQRSALEYFKHYRPSRFAAQDHCYQRVLQATAKKMAVVAPGRAMESLLRYVQVDVARNSAALPILLEAALDQNTSVPRRNMMLLFCGDLVRNQHPRLKWYMEHAETGTLDEELRKAILGCIRDIAGVDPGEETKQTPHLELVQSLYRIADFRWYADYLAGEIAPDRTQIVGDRGTDQFGFYLDRQIMQALYHWRDDKGQHVNMRDGKVTRADRLNRPNLESKGEHPDALDGSASRRHK